MSTIKSSDEHLTINADGSGKAIKLQNNGSESARIDSLGNVGIGATSANSSRLRLDNGGTAGAPQLMLTATGANTQTEIRHDTSGNLIFNNWNSGRTERMRIDSTGNVKVNTGNLVIGTSGKGIDFSATADGSGTSTSEVLDDFETGNWTPATRQGDASVTTIHNATYTKIGNIVHLQCYVTLDSNGSSTRYELQGMPFGGVASAYSTGTADIESNGWAMTRTNTSGTYLRFRKAFDNTWMAGSELDGGHLILGITYHTAD